MNHSARTAIVFIDGALEDTQTLIDAIPASAEVHILNGDSDGFDQINEILKIMTGSMRFIYSVTVRRAKPSGNSQLVTRDTHHTPDTLAVLKNTLTEDGDILLYGCDIAAGEDGQAFIEELAELTAADIAASDDITGAGGDWELEVATGPIETETIIASDYLGRLSNGVTSTTNVTEVHGATDLETGSGHAGDGQGIQITQEQTGIQTGAELNFNLGSNLTNDANLQLDSISFTEMRRQASPTVRASYLIMGLPALIGWIGVRMIAACSTRNSPNPAQAMMTCKGAA